MDKYTNIKSKQGGVPSGAVVVDVENVECPYCKKETKLQHKRIPQQEVYLIKGDREGHENFLDNLTEGQQADYDGTIMAGDSDSDWYTDYYEGTCQNCNKELGLIKNA